MNIIDTLKKKLSENPMMTCLVTTNIVVVIAFIQAFIANVIFQLIWPEVTAHTQNPPGMMIISILFVTILVITNTIILWSILFEKIDNWCRGD